MKCVALAFCLLAAVLSSPARASGADSKVERPKISVVGEATVYAVPDKIVIQFGVETSDKAMVAAKIKHNDILKKTFAAIKECGVREGDVQTNYLCAEPRWEDRANAQQLQTKQAYFGAAASGDPEPSRRFLGYFVRTGILVTVKDLANLDKLIAAVLDAGVNHIDGIEFQNTKMKKHREEARELALKAARTKAEKMAAVLGQTLGSPLDISENRDAPWSGSFNIQFYAVPPPGGSESSTDTIAFGKIPIHAGVDVTFELKK